MTIKKLIDTLVFGLTGFAVGIIVILAVMTKGRKRRKA